MNKLMALFDLFRKGVSVSDPVLWKTRQIKSTVLAAFILAVINVAAVFGYSIPIDTETANLIAAGIIALVNTVLTITTTNKIGIDKVEDTKAIPQADIPTVIADNPKVSSNEQPKSYWPSDIGS